jgi:hypothetical protein
MTDQRFARIQENGLVHIVMAYHTLSKHVSISFSGGTNKWFCFLENVLLLFRKQKLAIVKQITNLICREVVYHASQITTRVVTL